VKRLGYVVIFNNIPATFMCLCIAVLHACGQLFLVTFAHCSVSLALVQGHKSNTELYISVHLG
jgi:hypothetical protein